MALSYCKIEVRSGCFIIQMFLCSFLLSVFPSTFQLYATTSQVYWQRIKSLLNPGKILNRSSSVSFPGDRSHVMLPGLEPFSEYKLTVNVFNKKGKGPKSDPVTFDTPEGGEMTQIRIDNVTLYWAGCTNETFSIFKENYCKTLGFNIKQRTMF